MHDTLYPKAGGDNYDSSSGAGPETGEPLVTGAGVAAGGFGTTEDWSTWPNHAGPAGGPNPVPEDVDNTAFGRIEIPL